jgi:hypothetical protein
MQVHNLCQDGPVALLEPGRNALPYDCRRLRALRFKVFNERELLMNGMRNGISRREVLRMGLAAAVVGSLSGGALGQAAAAGSQAADKGKMFPERFLWGCATAAHQVEGNNTNSDYWTLEHLPGSMFKEPSGDACDHYHLYPQDISMLADLGFNTYRFSIEWARIEPEEGFFSNAELDHYKRMLAACHEHNLTTLLTYYHFSLPRWFAIKGGWQQEKAADLYARYCERVTKHLGDMVGYASTMNEPDVPQLLDWFNLPGLPPGVTITQAMQMSAANARKQLNAPDFGDFFFGDPMKTRDGLLSAHAKAREAMKSVRGDMPVGLNLARGQPPGREAECRVRALAGSGQTLRLPRSANLLSFDRGQEGSACAQGRGTHAVGNGILPRVRGARGALCKQSGRRAHHCDGERHRHRG